MNQASVYQMEVLSDIKDIEIRHNIRNFLKMFKIIYIDEKISEEAIKIRTTSKFKLPDAIVLATAVINNLIVYTKDIALNTHPNVKCLYTF